MFVASIGTFTRFVAFYGLRKRGGQESPGELTQKNLKSPEEIISKYFRS